MNKKLFIYSKNKILCIVMFLFFQFQYAAASNNLVNKTKHYVSNNNNLLKCKNNKEISQKNTTEYKALIDFIKQKKVSFYYILSIPRSRSTALQLSLVQSKDIDGQINLPMSGPSFERSLDLSFRFNDFRDASSGISLEEIAARINNVIRPILNQKGNAKFIIHDHISCLEQQHLSFLLEISDNFIFCIRTPRVQFVSYILRCLNHVFLEKDVKGVNSFSVEDLGEFLKYIDSPNLLTIINQTVIRKSIKIFQGDIWGRFTQSRETSIYANNFDVIFHKILHYVQKSLQSDWNNASLLLSYLIENTDGAHKKKINIVFVDGEEFVKKPEEVLRSIEDKINDLCFSNNMIFNWEKSCGNDFVCYAAADTENAWNGPSRKSDGITYKNDKTQGKIFEPSDLPKELSLTLENAIVIYNKFIDYFVNSSL